MRAIDLKLKDDPENLQGHNLPSRSIILGDSPDKERRALRWNYPGVSGASVETTVLKDVQIGRDFSFVRQKSGKSHCREDYVYQGSIAVGFAAYRLFTEEESRRGSATIKWLVLQPTGALNSGWETWDQNVSPPSTLDA